MKVGIVIGHNARNQGAVNYLGESEYYFNRRVAKKLQLKLEDDCISANIIERPFMDTYSDEVAEVVSQANSMGITHTFHLHFNSFNKIVKGCECLTVEHGADWIADLITDMLNERLGFKERGEDGVKRVQAGHRGHLTLKALALAGKTCVLIEPCFANFRTNESKIIFEQEDKYVELLADCIKIIKTKQEAKQC